MKLEQQVVGLDLAKRLKELGVKQESLFAWFQEKKEHTYSGYSFQSEVPWELLWSSTEQASGNETKFEAVVSAFTVAELGEMLPGVIENENAAYANRRHPNKGMRNAYYVLAFGKSDPSAKEKYCDIEYVDRSVHDDVLYLDSLTADTEADARAKMLVYLIENKLITV